MTKRQRVISVILAVWSVVLIILLMQNRNTSTTVSAPTTPAQTYRPYFTPTPIESTKLAEAVKVIQRATDSVFWTQTAQYLADNNLTHGDILSTDLARIATQQASNLAATVYVLRTLSPVKEGTLHPDFVQATQMVATTTQNAKNLTTTPQTIITATSFASYLVPPAPTLTSIPTEIPQPTISPQEQADLKASWLKELEDAVGFSHPALENAIEEMSWSDFSYLNTDDLSDFREDIRNASILTLLERVFYNDITYVAVLTNWMITDRMYKQLLLFKIEGGEPVFIPNPIKESSNAYGPYEFYGGGFKDRNGNGLLDLAIDTESGGMIGLATLIILEITEDGDIVDVSPSSIPSDDYVTRHMVDVENDGILEIVGEDMSKYPRKYFYRWNGETYVNMFPAFESLDSPEVEQSWLYMNNLSSIYLCNPLGSSKVLLNSSYNLLDNYDEIGQFETGWERLEPLLDWESCGDELDEWEWGDINLFLNWITYKLEGQQPIPTPQSLENLQAMWLAELEDAVGFSHPALTEAIDTLAQHSSWVLESDSDRIQNHHVQPEIQRTYFNGKNYIAVIIETDTVTWEHQTLVFRLEGNEAILISRLAPFLDTSIYEVMRFYEGGFKDRNWNGLPDIAILTNSTGSGGYATLVILELTKDGEIRNLTPIIPPELESYTHISREMVDIDNDGRLEVVIYELRHDVALNLHYMGIEVTHYYGWDSDADAYVDISHTLDESYYPRIERALQTLEGSSHNGCSTTYPLTNAFVALLDYDALGRFDKGWERIEPLLNWDDCDDINLTDEYRQQITDFQQWVADKLDEE